MRVNDSKNSLKMYLRENLFNILLDCYKESEKLPLQVAVDFHNEFGMDLEIIIDFHHYHKYLSTKDWSVISKLDGGRFQKILSVTKSNPNEVWYTYANNEPRFRDTDGVSCAYDGFGEASDEYALMSNIGDDVFLALCYGHYLIDCNVNVAHIENFNQLTIID